VLQSPAKQLRANRPNDMTCPLCMFVAGKVSLWATHRMSHTSEGNTACACGPTDATPPQRREWSELLSSLYWCLQGW